MKHQTKKISIGTYLWKLGYRALDGVGELKPEDIPNLTITTAAKRPADEEVLVDQKVDVNVRVKASFLWRSTIRILFNPIAIKDCDVRKGLVYIASKAKYESNPKFWDAMASKLDSGESFVHWLICPC